MGKKITVVEKIIRAFEALEGFHREVKWDWIKKMLLEGSGTMWGGCGSKKTERGEGEWSAFHWGEMRKMCKNASDEEGRGVWESWKIMEERKGVTQTNDGNVNSLITCHSSELVLWLHEEIYWSILSVVEKGRYVWVHILVHMGPASLQLRRPRSFFVQTQNFDGLKKWLFENNLFVGISAWKESR